MQPEHLLNYFRRRRFRRDLSRLVSVPPSPATAPYWKRSGRPPKREGLELIAEYFGVSIDYLLGKSMEIPQTNNAPIQTNRSEMFSILSQLTDQELDNLLQYAEFLLSKRQDQSGQDSL